MPLRYFNIDPRAASLGAMVQGLTARQQQLEEQRRIEREQSEAKKKRNLTMGLGAGLGAVGGLALAGPLGLAGTATVPGTLSGVPGALGTAGALGSFGSLSTAGALAAGLGGASIGASAAGMFGEGDIAGGLGAIAAPISNIVGQQENRRLQLEDRAGRLEDALSLDRGRTANDINRAAEVSTLSSTGRTRSENQVYQQAQSDFYGGLQQGPQFGEDIGTYGPIAGPMAGQPIQAFGAGGQGPPSPENNWAGLPPPPPNMTYDYGIGELNRFSRIAQDRRDTVDNPEWQQSNMPGARAAMEMSLRRREAAVRPGLVKVQPRPMMPGPDGSMVPIPLGISRDQDGNTVIFDGKDIKHTLKSKDDSEAARPLKVPKTGGGFDEVDADAAQLPEEMGGGIMVRKGVQYHAVKDGVSAPMSYKDYVSMMEEDVFDEDGQKIGKKRPSIAEYYAAVEELKGIKGVTAARKESQNDAVQTVANLSELMNTTSVPPEAVREAALMVGRAFGVGTPRELVDMLFAMKQQAESASGVEAGATTGGGKDFGDTPSGPLIAKLEFELFEKKRKEEEKREEKRKEAEQRDREQAAELKAMELDRQLHPTKYLFKGTRSKE